jgi:NAD(P)-dependent dehydrogenase (short-subunit alcohol dehydrogenase family)
VKTVVITGGTRGIGLGLAEAFLALGCAVVICGRKPKKVEKAIEKLAETHDRKRILGVVCDVTNAAQVQMLWQAAEAQFGKVDIWVNNAGVAHPLQTLWQQSAELCETVVRTNLLGAVHGSRVAVAGMLQQGFGSVYNMAGFGARRGSMMKGMTVYGATKSAIHYFTRSLAKELKGKPVIVGELYPGMVATEMLSEQYKDRPEEFEKDKKVFNILASRVEEVAPWLAKRMLKNHRSGAQLAYMNTFRLLKHLLLVLAGRRRLFDEKSVQE